MRFILLGALLLNNLPAGEGPGKELGPSPARIRPCGVVEAERIVADLTRVPLRASSSDARTEWRGGLRITFAKPAGSVRLLAPKHGRDLNDAVLLGVDIRNDSAKSVTLTGELNRNSSTRGFLHLPPGGRGTMALHLMRLEDDNKRIDRFPGMNGVPGGFMRHWEAANKSHLLKSLQLSDLDGGAVNRTITVTTLRAIGRYGPLPEPGDERFFPFVDSFGQFRHATWPEKIASTKDLKRVWDEEAADITAHPGPGNRSRFGGWKDGPRLDATGHFRTALHQGKWWLVDPEGHLFWSHGVTGVGKGSKTRINGRRQFFTSIPGNHHTGNSIDFYQANLERKFDDGWKHASEQLAHRRLRSWGMNSIGNWSETSLSAMQRTPYTMTIPYRSNEGNPRRDPKLLREALESSLEKHPARDDPWCIGFFVDNELKWNEVMEPELYFRTVSEVIKRLAPNKLYLGSRLHGHKHVLGGPKPAATAAAKYCDVVTINRYRFSPSDLRMPEGADKPILIGEFHFGALDRGMFHPGLRGVASQQQRGAAYRHYLTQALRHPNIVGTHWFQYREQAVSGRSDGENYQIGFVDIADTPSARLVAASRAIGEVLYEMRAGRPHILSP